MPYVYAFPISHFPQENRSCLITAHVKLEKHYALRLEPKRRQEDGGNNLEELLSLTTN